MTCSEIVEQNPEIVRVRFERDDEHDSSGHPGPWWQAAGKTDSALYAGRVRHLRSYTYQLTLRRTQAIEFLRWCESLLGWEDGPHYAKRPLIIRIIFRNGDWDAID